MKITARCPANHRANRSALSVRREEAKSAPRYFFGLRVDHKKKHPSQKRSLQLRVLRFRGGNILTIEGEPTEPSAALFLVDKMTATTRIMKSS